MKQLTILFILTTIFSFGQSTNEPVYDWKFVLKRVKKNKMSISAGTREIISEISTTYQADIQQKELIKFFRTGFTS